MTAALPEIPTFEILVELGSGGMGTVYLARHRGPHGFEKLVALKVLPPGRFATDAIRAMFIDEARLAGQLAHPCIAQVYSFGEADGQLYLVMEYVTGLTFSELMKSVGERLTPLMCACLAARVCRGLHAAHELKNPKGHLLDVVHRDVTPQNLVLTFDGEVKILDFGIALMHERTAPATHQQFVRGKPTYLAPEQREKQAVDRRADIYSLSIVLYEMLTGKKLFTFAMTVSSQWKEIAATIPPPSALIPLPDGLDAIVLKGLALDPKERFQTAREMALALEEVIEREGCESLESFAERELSSHREARTKDVCSVLRGEPELTTQLVRTRTQVDDAPLPRPETPTKEDRAPAPSTEEEESSILVIPAGPFGGLGRKVLRAGLFFGATLFLGMIALLWQEMQRVERPAAAAPIVGQAPSVPPAEPAIGSDELADDEDRDDAKLSKKERRKKVSLRRKQRRGRSAL